MASQKLTILAVGGKLADEIWNQAQQWSDQRTTYDPNEWNPEHWPLPIRQEIDSLAGRLLTEAFTPPILYWSQHVDLWSMGDIYHSALSGGSTLFKHLLSNRFELFCRHLGEGEKFPRSKNWTDEDRWLKRRLQEAATAWSAFAPTRVIVLI